MHTRRMLFALTALALMATGAWAQNAATSGPQIQIAGGFTMATYARQIEGYVPGSNQTEVAKIKASEFRTDTASFTFRITPQDQSNHFLTVRMQLDDAWGRNGVIDQDDILREVFYTFNNIGGSGFGVKVGKQRIPFGLNNTALIISPYIDGDRKTMFRERVNGQTIDNIAGYQSPLREEYAYHNSTRWDRLFAIAPYWEGFDKKLLVEATLFQAKRDVNVNNLRSNDDLLFNSGALKVTVRPIEGLSLTGSVLARGNRTSKDSDNDRHASHMYASSLSGMYNFKVAGRATNLFVEWQHSWNSYNDVSSKTGNTSYYWKDSSSDDVHFGFAYQLTDTFKLHMQGEWLKMRNDRRNTNGAPLAANADSRMWRAIVALETKLPGGIVMESGYQQEWLKRYNAVANNPLFADTKSSFKAGTWYSGLKFSF